MSYGRAAVLTTAIAMLSAVSAPAQTVPKDVSMQLESGWAFLRQLDEQECQYSVKGSRFDPKEGVMRETTTVRIDRKPGFFRCTTFAKEVTGTMGFNPDYFFSIGQRDGKDAYLTRATRTDPDGTNVDIRDTILSGPMTMSFFPLSCINLQPGDVLLRNSSFRIVSVRPAESGLLDVRVQFDQTIPGRPPAPTSITLTLDPSRYHCVLRYRYDEFLGEKKDIEFSRIVGELNGRLVCTRCELKQPSARYHRVCTFEDYDFALGQPDRQYYLSHYGLPEPVGVTAPKKAAPLFMWLLVAAAVAVILAISFRFLAKGRPPKPAGEATWTP
jgi:hypothetical protein